MTPLAIYEQQINDYKAEISQVQRRLSILGWTRLAFFVAALYCGYAFFSRHFDYTWLAAAIVLLGGFVVLLIRYLSQQEKLTLLKTFLELNEKEWQLAASGQSGFDDGGRFADEQHPYTGDLDVFGHASLYAHVNRTGTLLGSNALADALKTPLQGVEQIAQHQAVIRELAPRFKFRQLFAVHAALTNEQPEDVAGLKKWLSLPLEFLDKKWLNIARWLMPALLVVGAVFYFVTDQYYLFTCFFCINLLILGANMKKVGDQHQLLSNKEKTFGRFALLLRLINAESAGSAVLLKEQQGKATAANNALHQLSRICSAMDQRLNQLVGLALNSLVLYDLHCVFALEKWKERNKEEVQGWLDVIARMEVWNSMATFAYNHPAYIYPTITGETSRLIATGIGHPLIPAEECVRNGISIGNPQEFLIITGSNMSGKSTFLRSVGSNLLMGMCGMPVCAESFSCSPMQIMTSMRIKDSIAKHTSYFQAELLRLQQIVEVLKGGERVFILLDEILKGTNSEDKLSGSRRLIEHFLQYHCLGMIATHDLELGHLEETYPQRIRNYCFESTIKDDQLFFDYRIREGVARNKNATFLMQKMEII
ncbi:MutS-related protein [Chitinophaga pinensis]|uniref:DNA mismatch repair protein MutS domain protein n=1 Tax=Chitinophaga pinensis (strain ATCC 43595 / DSM 2588 / LMG 13176 / NBRC 15968 / NCIMB 11800 / UQM 2034) TaxID=485918 RepID=A0A979G0K7_CHIPD|nr:DNA mismatch repair protein MutS [Chitinophaga pinensis]ACU58568.1 DNA mismatch repair protein MutS domain protein [Chitinophaga pinensis DSM 2588]